MRIEPDGCTRRTALVALGACAWTGAAATRAPILASVCPDDVDPALYLVSEKYDGVRALWDGRVLRHRSGRVVSAPQAFLASLPGCALDGELWLGRGRFDEVSGLVRTAAPTPQTWAGVRYMAFELPGAGGTFRERTAKLSALADATSASPLRAVAQSRIADRDGLRRRLAQVVAVGGEGLMLHLASAAEASGRSDVLLKLKPHLDAEATVLGHRPGHGKYAGLVGALAVETADGVRFLLGSGLSDELRRGPPPVGSLVTFRYRDRTPAGVPRFATFLRRHEPL